MQKKEFLNKIEDIVDVPLGTLGEEIVLKELSEWDSIAVMSFISLVDEIFEITLDADKIRKCVTINDLLVLLDGKIGD